MNDGRHVSPLDENRIRSLIALVYILVILALYGWFLVNHPYKGSMLPAGEVTTAVLA